jgi:hypothetical protein
MNSRFEGKHKSCDVETIINDIEGKTTRPINLNPDYQRDVVWDERKQSNFIDSLYKGIVPNSLIFNYKPTERVCIDGKQRTTSIINFYHNEIPLILQNDELEEEYIYFSNIPDTVSNDEKCRIMTDEEKQKFLERHLSIVSYDNLSYEEETEIFNRIQNGEALTEGEKIFSIFKKEKNTKTFKKFCEKHKERFNSNVRNNHAIDIVEYMYMCEKDTLKRPTKTQREKFVKELETKKKLSKFLKKIEPIIENIQPIVLEYELSKNNRFALTMLLYKNYDTKTLSDDDVKEINLILKRFCKRWKKWQEQVKKEDLNMTPNKTYEKIEYIFDDITEELSEILSDIDNNSEDNDNNEEVITYVKPKVKKKIIKKLSKRTTKKKRE